MSTRNAIWQTIGILLLAAVVALPPDPTSWVWGAVMGCFLSALCAIWIDVWRAQRPPC